MAQYRFAKTPFEVGQERIRMWRALVMPQSVDDPMWLERIASYWQLQAETYGVKFHPDYVIALNRDEGIVFTAAYVAEVLPGERVMFYKAPRARQ